VELIHDSALRCQKIVKNLLSFARENKPERKNQSVNEIVEKTLDMKKYQLHVNSIEVERELDRTLPRALVDFHQLQQVLLNLINNAQHAMMTSRKAEPSKLRVTTSLGEGGIQIEISDNGEGMEQETLERIFDPFFTTKETGQGTGLGLSVSYGIINEHGGRIWASSTRGERTTFTIELPVRDEDRIAPVETSDVLVGEPPVRPGSRILVVDDEPVILQLFVNLFEGRGYKVDTAVNGRDAVEQIALRGYDLIVTDVRMPEMNGIELYPKILARRPELEGRVIFITGDLGDTETARFLSDTDAQTLTKPLEIREVVRVVDAALAQPSSARSC
jgi:CheY-like chemotaxis protein